MKIKSKKTGREEIITPNDWEKMKKNDLSRNFEVISHEETISFGKVEMPAEVREVMVGRKTKKEIQEALEEKGVEYSKSDNKADLIEKYGREGITEEGIDEAV